MMMEDQKNNEGEAVKSLIALNKLNYQLPPTINLGVECKHVSNFPTSSVYAVGASTNQTMVFDSSISGLNTFTDCADSYLRFKITATAPLEGGNAGTYLRGGIQSVFKSIVILNQGTEISRIDDMNVIMLQEKYWTKSNTYFQSAGNAEGLIPLDVAYADSKAPEADGKYDSPNYNSCQYILSNTSTSFVLPLSSFGGFFQQGALLPPQVMAGLRLEITLAPPIEVFSYNVDAPSEITADYIPASYSLTDIAIQWKTQRISDTFGRSISDTTAREGLSLLYKEYYHTRLTAATTSINYDVKKACSHALRCIIIARAETDLVDVTGCTLAPSAYKFKDFQANVANTYLPQQKVVMGVGFAGKREGYLYASQAWGNLGAVPYQRFYNGNGLARGFHPCLASLCFDLSTSKSSPFAGLEINNNRALLFTLSVDDSVQTRYDTFLQHARVLKVFANSMVVKD